MELCARDSSKLEQVKDGSHNYMGDLIVSFIGTEPEPSDQSRTHDKPDGRVRSSGSAGLANEYWRKHHDL